mmetsp:Transcript_11951/g.36887  ORF Transcript_11951/g.36887 Transcript_11951/m.36887 type:complete len:233 (-) Transcript_11951:864-1562(-)
MLGTGLPLGWAGCPRPATCTRTRTWRWRPRSSRSLKGATLSSSHTRPSSCLRNGGRRTRRSCRRTRTRRSSSRSRWTPPAPWTRPRRRGTSAPRSRATAAPSARGHARALARRRPTGASTSSTCRRPLALRTPLASWRPAMRGASPPSPRSPPHGLLRWMAMSAPWRSVATCTRRRRKETGGRQPSTPWPLLAARVRPARAPPPLRQARRRAPRRWPALGCTCRGRTLVSPT